MTRYEAIQAAFGLERDDLWATPSSLFPTAHNDTVRAITQLWPPSAAGPAWGSMPSYEVRGLALSNRPLCHDSFPCVDNEFPI